MAPITPLHVHQLVQRNRPLFLAGIDSFDHVHIILGTNSLAAARCESSLAVGAKPIVIAHEQASIHRTLQAQIDAGNVLLKTKAFEYNDLLRLGRQQVGGVVDAVFVTTQLHNEESTWLLTIVSFSSPLLHSFNSSPRNFHTNSLQSSTSLISANKIASQSTLSTHRTFQPSQYFRRTPMDHCKSG